MNKTLLFVILLFIIAGGAGFYEYSKLEKDAQSSISVQSLISAAQSGNEGDTGLDQVRSGLSALSDVSRLSSFDIKFLDSPEFDSLRDFSVTLSPAQNIGRSNPFDLVGVEIPKEIIQITPVRQTESSVQPGSTVPLEEIDAQYPILNKKSSSIAPELPNVPNKSESPATKSNSEKSLYSPN